MVAVAQIRTVHGTHMEMIALVLAIVSGETLAYNCSRSLSPWIYINESSIIKGNPILYEGQPIRDIISWSRRRTSTFFTSPFDIIEWDADKGFYFSTTFSVDAAIPWYVPLGSITLDYDVTCSGGDSNSISFVLLDVNNKKPIFAMELQLSISLSPDTCKGQEIFNFAYNVRDPDFADKPNNEKLQLFINGQSIIVDQRSAIADVQDNALGVFEVSGRMGLQLNGTLDKNIYAYRLSVSLKDQASNYGQTVTLLVNTAKASAQSSSDTNLPKKCKSWNETNPGYTFPYNCSGTIFTGLLESKVYGGLRITYNGYPVRNVTGLTRNTCTGLANSSFELLDLANDDVLVVRADFNLDDVIQQGLHDVIYCVYNFTCQEQTTANSVKGSIKIYVVDENDEEPVFTPDAPSILHVSQETELIYSFRPHVHDSDFADWPNDERLEMLIINPLLDSCGNAVPGAISITERLVLRIQPPLKVTACPPYHLTLALKDHAMRIGPHHNVTLNVSTDRDVYCESLTLNISVTRILTLPRMPASSVIEPLCISTGEPLLVARCVRLSQYSPLAEYNVNLSKSICSDGLWHTQLVDLHLVPVTENSVLDLILGLRNLTSNSSELLPAGLSYVSHILEDILQFDEYDANSTELLIKIAPYVADTVSNLMEASNDVLEEARRTDNMFTSGVIGSVDTMLLQLAEAISEEDVNATTDGQLAFESKNLAIQVTTDAVIAGTGACLLANGARKRYNVSYDSSFSDCLQVTGLPEAELRLSAATRGVPRIFVTYKNAALFGSGTAKGAAVLSAQLTRKLEETSSTGQNLVTWRHRLDKAAVDKGFRLDCGYWNLSANRWDTYGCSYERTEDGQGMFVCSCDHLTNFAVLMVPCVGNCNDDVHDEILSYMSLIFLTVSSVALSLVLVTFLAYRELRRSDGQRLTACLSASLLCINLFFIFGINGAKENAEACAALAAVLHYFLLTTFLFMTAEVILSYLLLVKVLNAHVSHFIWKVLAVCLGVPAGLVIGVRFGDPLLYVREDRYCWVQPTLEIYGVMLPIGLAIAFNLVMFALIARALYHRPQLRCSISERLQARRQAKALAAIFVLLGITWAFGLLAAVEASTIVFQYLFVITNALQGVFVFIFHNVKAPTIARSLKNALISKIRSSSKKESDCSNGTEGDMALSKRTDISDASGNRVSSGADGDPSLINM